MYLAYRIAFCIATRNGFNIILHGQKNFQQFVVDEWGKVESQRLLWTRNNQKTLRADIYRGMEYSLANQDIANTGTATILPASVTGSP